MDYKKESLKKHKEYKGKIWVRSKVPLENKEDLSLYYTPGVAQPCLEIAKDPKVAYDYTRKNNSVAVISDGTAVLGLGNIGGLASLPVMEGKAILMKEFAGLDAVPIVLQTQDPDEIINIVKNISISFWAINLEDIKAPQCFYIEDTLQELTDIPIFHDDQHGTAIVVLAALLNALKVTEKKKEECKVVIAWAWAAGTATARILREDGFKNIVCVDSKGAIHTNRDNLTPHKEILAWYNSQKEEWSLQKIIQKADIFIWVSRPDILTYQEIQSMNEKPIVFALSNPDPEITEQEAEKWWAHIYAAWRSDVKVQINNLIVFPGVLRWLIDARIENVAKEHKLAAAYAIANMVNQPHKELLLPNSLDKNIANIVAQAIIDASNEK